MLWGVGTRGKVTVRLFRPCNPYLPSALGLERSVLSRIVRHDMAGRQRSWADGVNGAWMPSLLVGQTLPILWYGKRISRQYQSILGAWSLVLGPSRDPWIMMGLK